MKYVRIIDEDGFYIEDRFVDKLSEYTIATPSIGGLHKPRWDGSKWIEGLTQLELEVLHSVKRDPTVDELQTEQNVDMDFRISLLEMGL